MDVTSSADAPSDAIILLDVMGGMRGKNKKDAFIDVEFNLDFAFARKADPNPIPKCIEASEVFPLSCSLEYARTFAKDGSKGVQNSEMTKGSIRLELDY